MLSQLAASMSAGTWAQLNANGLDVLGITGSQGGVGGNMIPYSNQAVWDPVANAIRYGGNDHHGGQPPFTVLEIQYLDSNNTWSMVTNQIPGMTPSHGYGHDSLRPDTGEFFIRDYGYGTSNEVIWHKQEGGSWSSFTGPSVYRQVGIGTAWWSGTLSGSGPMGALVVWESGGGDLLVWDPPPLDQWQDISVAIGVGDGLYHSVADYSPGYNCVVFGGGNALPNKLWKLDANRTVTQLADPPIEIGVQHGNLIHDPVSGEFLLWGGGVRQFWKLDPTGTGTYTQLSGSRQPPVAVSDPALGNPDSLISVPISTYGVVAYMSAVGASTTNMYLYKHN